jgi:hypothetical protein
MDRNPQPAQLVGVDPVATHPGGDLDHPHHLRPRLQGVICGDQPDIAGSHHQHPAPGEHPVAIDQGLEGAGPHHPGEGGTGETELSFPRPGRHQHHLRFDQPVAAVAHHPDTVIGEHPHRRGRGPQLHRRELGQAGGQIGGDRHPAYARRGEAVGTEELVGLQHELSTRTVLVIDQQRVHSGGTQLDGRRQPGRPGADHQHIDGSHPGGPQLGRLVIDGEFGQRVGRSEVHPVGDRRHTGLHRHPVGDHHTRGALAVGAEQAERGTVAGVATEHVHTGCHQRRRDHLALAGMQEALLPEDGHGGERGRVGQHRMTGHPGAHLGIGRGAHGFRVMGQRPPDQRPRPAIGQGNGTSTGLRPARRGVADVGLAGTEAPQVRADQGYVIAGRSVHDRDRTQLRSGEDDRAVRRRRLRHQGRIRPGLPRHPGADATCRRPLHRRPPR